MNTYSYDFINKYNEDKKKELDIIQNMSEYDYSMMELNKKLKIAEAFRFHAFFNFQFRMELQITGRFRP